MSIVRSALFTGCAHASKVLMGFVLLKIMAVYLGPEGVGKLGHLMSVVSVLTILSGGGIVNGLVKYCSEYKAAPATLFRFVSSAATYALIFSLLVCVLSLAFSAQLSLLVFGSDEFVFVIVILAVAQVAMAFSNVVFGVSNGLQDTNVFAFSQILGNVVAVPVLWFCVSQYLVSGAAVSLILASSLCALPALYFFRRSVFWGRIRLFRSNISSFGKLFSYTVMLAVSALAFPLVEIAVRAMLIAHVGYHDAGVWQGAIRLSAAYLGFFTMFLAFYFVPRISPESCRKAVAKITLQHLLLVQVVFFAGASVLYLAREFFIGIIFSSAFESLSGFIVYQLLGDFFKIGAYVIGFVAVAKAETRVYVAAEVLQGVVFLGGAWWAITQRSSVESVMQAYLATYVLYFLICLVGLRMYVRRQA